MTHTTIRAATATVILSALAILAVVAFTATNARAVEPGCWGGAGIGANMLASHTDAGARLDIGTASPIGSVELGCDLRFADHYKAGARIQYDLTNMRAALDTESLRANGRWMALVTLGYMLNPMTQVYGLAGIASTRWTLVDVASATGHGWVAGAGLEISLDKSPMALFVEYNAVKWISADLGVLAWRPTEHVARMGVRYRLGGQ